MTVSTTDYLAPGFFVNSDSPDVRAFAAGAVGSQSEPAAQASLLFEAVRDQFWYDPFGISTEPAHYRASAVVNSTSNWCVPKAVLLAAAARAVGIPARLGFADVRNHLQTPRLRERMGGQDLFVYHGYTDLHLNGQWVKATPAFNSELCARFGVAPIAFDGHSDALLHPHSADGGSYMEYLHDRGTYVDLPLPDILTALNQAYGHSIVSGSPTGEPASDTVDQFTAPHRGG